MWILFSTDDYDCILFKNLKKWVMSFRNIIQLWKKYFKLFFSKYKKNKLCFEYQPFICTSNQLHFPKQKKAAFHHSAHVSPPAAIPREINHTSPSSNFHRVYMPMLKVWRLGSRINWLVKCPTFVFRSFRLCGNGDFFYFSSSQPQPRILGVSVVWKMILFFW